eukprot:4961580-Pyramimonas_sp.AAC.1
MAPWVARSGGTDGEDRGALTPPVGVVVAGGVVEVPELGKGVEAVQVGELAQRSPPAGERLPPRLRQPLQQLSLRHPSDQLPSRTGAVRSTNRRNPTRSKSLL